MKARAQSRQTLSLIEPPKRPDGTCSACVGGWQCGYHQREGVARDKAQAAVIAEVAQFSHDRLIQWVIATCQLESDERGTATQKAEWILEAR